MYRQRILPLFLAFVLCTTQVSARERSFLEIAMQTAFYAVGIVGFAAWIGFNYKKYQTEKYLQYEASQRIQSMTLMVDAAKLRATKYGLEFTPGQINEMDLSKQTFDLINKVRAKQQAL